MSAGDRALLIYDGECECCRVWVDHWQTLTGERVQYAAASEIAAKFPDISREKYALAVNFMVGDGRRYAGAAAVFRLTAARPGFGWVRKLYEAPMVAPCAEWMYRLAAEHRPFCLKLTRWLWGIPVETPRHGLTTRLFLQALAAIYFFVFASLFFQLPGLVGEHGLLPAETYLQALQAQHGGAAGWLAPTLAWHGAHAGALQFMALFGALAALLAFGGILIAPCFLLMWVLFLSIAVVGQGFTAAPPDSLLLEVGFLAIFLVPFRRAVTRRFRLNPSSAVIWLYRFLLFRILFSGAVAELSSANPAWKHLSALSSYLETQPLPTWLAWHLRQWPTPALQALTFGTLCLQLLLPFLFFLPRRARRWGAIVLAAAQVAWMLMGQTVVWTALVLALCLLLLDDACFERGDAGRPTALESDRKKTGVVRTGFVGGVTFLLIALGVARLSAPFVRLPAPALLLAAVTEPFRISNDYELFPLLGAARTEIILEGSMDGVAWKEYVLKRQPGDVKRAPALLAFQARFAWWMALAAREDGEADFGLRRLMLSLLQGSRSASALLDSNPFAETPPRYVRAASFVYRFTTSEERRRDGSWWRRERKADDLPMLSLDAAYGPSP